MPTADSAFTLGPVLIAQLTLQSGFSSITASMMVHCHLGKLKVICIY